MPGTRASLVVSPPAIVARSSSEGGRGEQAERDLWADAADRQQRLEQMALVGRGEAIERQQILADMQVRVEQHLAADLAERAKHIARGVDQEAHAAGLDHAVVDSGKDQFAPDRSDHNRYN